MNFADFQIFRQRLLAERPQVLDAAATNLYAALAHLIPLPTPAPSQKMHRCHLASDWAAHFGVEPAASRRALITCGVRDSLVRLFRHYRRAEGRVWLPADCYPVYHELARAAGLTPQSFPTLPSPQWPVGSAAPGPEVLLVTNPLKPLGRWLTDGDVDELTGWLAASPQRRLMLDTVYTFEPRFHATTLRLLANGQSILLHSLTKGWLQPRLFGVALVPESDLSGLAESFRAEPPPQENLGRARGLLVDHATLPAVVAGELAVARARLHSAALVGLPCPFLTDAPGYFTPIRIAWRDLLERHQILGLPPMIFGSIREDLTILSSLTSGAKVSTVRLPLSICTKSRPGHMVDLSRARRDR